MWSVDGLVGLEFKGFFQVSKEWRDGKRAHRNKLKIEHPQDVARYDEIQAGMSETKDAFADRPHDFWIKILEYDPASNLFIAKGHDFLGESGLMGEITASKINFLKVYAGKVPEGSQGQAERFGTVKYEGEICKPDKVITCGGDYFPPAGYNSKLGGDWRLDSQPKK